MEALPTVLAGVGPDVGVDEQMGGESGGTLEDLSTHRTTKGFLLQYKHDGLGRSYDEKAFSFSFMCLSTLRSKEWMKHFYQSFRRFRKY